MPLDQAIAARPPILLIDEEADILAELALGIRDKHPNVSRLLLEELIRAETVPSEAIPEDVVTMGSTVAFAIDATGERRTVTLVYPKDADLESGRLSVMTPVGAGLIGLRVGQSISWPDRSGQERLLKVERVTRG
jgi:regulator of nucleoside diphosphate kinase